MNTFSKQERLTGKKEFEDLIKKGSSFFLFPFRVVVFLAQAEPNTPSAVLGISVSKRKFKLAVSRNRIKRLIRESYRKNKSEGFYQSLLKKGLHCKFLLIYTHSKIPDYKTIDQKLILILQKLDHDHIQAI